MAIEDVSLLRWQKRAETSGGVVGRKREGRRKGLKVWEAVVGQTLRVRRCVSTTL